MVGTGINSGMLVTNTEVTVCPGNVVEVGLGETDKDCRVVTIFIQMRLDKLGQKYSQLLGANAVNSKEVRTLNLGVLPRFVLSHNFVLLF